MDVTLYVPDDLAERLSEGGDLSRRVLEAFAAHEYRHGRIAKPELQRLLGIKSESDLDVFLKAHGVWVDDTAEEAARALRSVERIDL